MRAIDAAALIAKTHTTREAFFAGRAPLLCE
jgi:hypothetical protein